VTNFSHAQQEQSGSARKTVTFSSEQGLLTDGGGAIAPLTLADETYGKLNEEQKQRDPIVSVR